MVRGQGLPGDHLRQLPEDGRGCQRGATRRASGTEDAHQDRGRGGHRGQTEGSQPPTIATPNPAWPGVLPVDGLVKGVAGRSPRRIAGRRLVGMKLTDSL